MAQPKLIPIQPDIELVTDEAALLPHNPISRAIQRPKVPTRARMLAERQATAMQFQKDRSAFLSALDAAVNRARRKLS